MENEFSVRTLPVAEQDIDAAVDFLLLEDPSVALSFLDGLQEIERRLSEFPRSGSLVQDEPFSSLGYRYMLLIGYYVFYKIDGDSVWIMRVIHTKRNYSQLL